MESTKKLTKFFFWYFFKQNGTKLDQADLRWCAFCMANFETVLSWRFSDILIQSIPKDQWKWNPKILEIFGICHWYPFLLNFSTFWPARMTDWTIQRRRVRWRGWDGLSEDGVAFSLRHDDHLKRTYSRSSFSWKKRSKKAIANFDSTQLGT